MTAQPIEQTSSIPENGIHVADPDLWAAEKVLPLFEKLRNEAKVIS